MLKYKKITQEQHDAADRDADRADDHPSRAPAARPPEDRRASSATTSLDDPRTTRPSARPRTSAKLLSRGGLDVYTTLDLDLQDAAADGDRPRTCRSRDPSIDVGATAVSVQPGTGRVLAMAQNKTFTNDPDVLATGRNYTAVNYNTDFDYGGSSGFQPGSTYKIFTLAEWLKEGHSLNECVDACKRSRLGHLQRQLRRPQIYAGGLEPRQRRGRQRRLVHGPVQHDQTRSTPASSPWPSSSTCAASARPPSRSGVHRADGDPLQQGPGDDPRHQRDRTAHAWPTAFAGVADNGIVCKPDRDRQGREAGRHRAHAARRPSCAQGVDPKVAAAMAYAMQRVDDRRNRVDLATVAPTRRSRMIGKTGTTDNNEATWMSGASTKVATDRRRRSTSAATSTCATPTSTACRPRSSVTRSGRAIMSVANAKYGGDAFPDADPSSLKTVTPRFPTCAASRSTRPSSSSRLPASASPTAAPRTPSCPPARSRGTNPSGDAPRGSLGDRLHLERCDGADAERRRALRGRRQEPAQGHVLGARPSNVDVTDPKQVGRRAVQRSRRRQPGVKPGSQVTISIGKLKATPDKPGKG